MSRNPIARSAHALGDLTRVLLAVVARTALWTALLLAAWSTLPAALGWHVTTVASGSMTPAIQVGDVVAAMPVAADVVAEGHVLLVDDPDHAGRLRLHRVDDVLPDGRLRLRGDANPTADSTPITPDAVTGLAVVRIPWIGLPGTWFQQQEWMLLVAASGAFGLLALGARLDRSIARGDVCRRCGSPRWSTENIVGDRPGARPSLVAVPAAVLAVALVAQVGASASFSGVSDTWASLGTSASFPCFTRVADSPALAWDFAERDGSAVVDASTGGNPGTLTGSMQRVDGSCSENPYAQATEPGSGVAATRAQAAPMYFSSELWFRTTTPGRLMGYSSSATGNSTSVDRNVYVTGSGTVAFGVSRDFVMTGTRAVTDGQWHHLVATFDGRSGVSGTGVSTMWLDGERVTSRSDVRFGPWTGRWRVGYDAMPSWAGAVTDRFSGAVDTIRVYDRVLDDATIRRHHDAGR